MAFFNINGRFLEYLIQKFISFKVLKKKKRLKNQK